MWTDQQEQELKARFLRLYGSSTLWGLVREAYAEPHRSYHDLGHLASLFELFDQFRHLLNNPQAVEHALWWHDAVYSVGARRDENEVRSAMLLRRSFVMHANTLLYERPGAWDDVEVGCLLIEATAEHSVSSPILVNDENLASDAALFLDMDMAILAADLQTLRQFEDGVRKEYGQYSEGAYTFGRIAVLKSMLAREKIFLSPAFSSREQSARENLELLIAELTERRANCSD